jgi:hypothetical protein
MRPQLSPTGYSTKLRSVSSFICRSSGWEDDSSSAGLCVIGCGSACNTLDLQYSSRVNFFEASSAYTPNINSFLPEAAWRQAHKPVPRPTIQRFQRYFLRVHAGPGVERHTRTLFGFSADRRSHHRRLPVYSTARFGRSHSLATTTIFKPHG